MEKSKEEFLNFIRDSTSDRNSDAFIELYQFLLSAYVRADADLDGKVSLDEFDRLIEEAAALPMKYGMSRKAEEQFPDEATRQKVRAEQFAAIDFDKDGAITFEEWLSYAEKDIYSKAKDLPLSPLYAADATKDQFLAFIKKTTDTKSDEYRTLYHYLLKCFVDADADRDGSVNPTEFDLMIEHAEAVPQKFGLLPPSKELFKTEDDRKASRLAAFKTMDVNGDGKISFDEWLSYAIKNIIVKAAN